ncbi:glyoxysomal processing protease, glyoxysomal isoform X1 [Iris pallida]|uniref:Glyoxysomal processing protease, glyoxysomal isoform X1 n=1 Tax=Iris pallida TaxID=29817 RepID=A0AAX6EXW4_IRIPA|nr:glyoxysomal processing protease, glyoxysomal isoform X1 [Iris pallida]
MKKREMEPSEIAQMARNFSVMVRVQGPDPKGLKMRRHAFHLHQSGNTTLSASGLLLPEGCLRDLHQTFEYITKIHHHSGALVITMASVVEPFLTAQHRDNPTKELLPKLIPDARIDVLVEEREEGRKCDSSGTTSCWLPSQLLAFVDVSTSSCAFMSLIGAHSGSHAQVSWEVGWSLAPVSNDPLTGIGAFQRQVGKDNRSSYDSHGNMSLDEPNSAAAMAMSATRIAVLGCSTGVFKDVLNIDASQPQNRGDMLLVMGSPFGLLSPLHFYNSISLGAIANLFPVGANRRSLLMADIRCLPGMEGAPAFDKYGCLAGILTRPLKQKGSSVEIQLVISWVAIATALSSQLQNKAHRSLVELTERSINSAQSASVYCSSNFRRSAEVLPRGSNFPSVSGSSLENALSSVVLVTVGDGAWASGIVLNKHGLVLTNAHILEPWRFGRTSLLGLMDKATRLSVEREKSFSQLHQKECQVERSSLLQSHLGSSEANRHESSPLNSSYRSYKKIAVRLDHMEQQIWHNARAVYVSKGPWDVALLQLESVPNELRPITTEFASPPTGSTIHVIGHGLLGPRSDILPSVSSGILANMVRIPGAGHLQKSSILGTEESQIPVMLQTTAAVHPGASGGAVVNSDGRMIGLVTSNARHGGGTIIPHLNFSIPCAALKPIFEFADKQDAFILQVLDDPNEIISSIWALQTPPSPTEKSLLEKNKREGKGTRFSQFLAEKQAEFTPLKDGGQLIRGKFPSRL